MKSSFLVSTLALSFVLPHGDSSQDSSITEKLFILTTVFVDIPANAFCLPLSSSLPFLLSSFKMTTARAFSLSKELGGESTDQVQLGERIQS